MVTVKHYLDISPFFAKKKNRSLRKKFPYLDQKGKEKANFSVSID
jgi:hypothetical protein